MACHFLSRLDRPSIWSQFAAGAALYFLTYCSWSDPVAESHRSLIDLDGEVQAIKLETLAISQQLSQAENPRQSENLEQLLTQDPSQLARQDYLTAIGLLQQAESRDLLTDNARLLLARLKLAYGLYAEAGFDLHAVGSEGVSGRQQNRAWYELAVAYYGKGYHRAALEALNRLHGDPPADVVGEIQLLHANVLMSLGRDLEATQVLRPWRGSAALEAYGHYNLGIALLRSGEQSQAISAMQDAISTRVFSEETAALRDKARLSLGHILARQGNYRAARKHLQAVRQQGLQGNRALLALGWIAHQEGKQDAALESWETVRSGSPADPTVLETLILVPALHREAEDLKRASRDYESAVMAYENELLDLNIVRDQLRVGDTMARLLDGFGHPVDIQARDLLGTLLASRELGAIRRDRSDLYTILEVLEQDLREVTALSYASPSEAAPLPQVEASPPENDALESPTIPGAGKSPESGQKLADKLSRDLTPSSSPGTYSLPEIDSPVPRQIKPLPDSGSSNQAPSRSRTLPQSAQWLKEPPDAEIFGMPDSEIISLPTSGDFFRRPGEAELEDYAYPDDLPIAASRARSSDLLPEPEAASSFDPGSQPAGTALQELAAALNPEGAWRPAEGEPLDPMATGAERERQIAALSKRILALRERINLTFTQYENHARALALAELDRRQILLEDLQEKASLELAKTYDQHSQR